MSDLTWLFRRKSLFIIALLSFCLPACFHNRAPLDERLRVNMATDYRRRDHNQDSGKSMEEALSRKTAAEPAGHGEFIAVKPYHLFSPESCSECKTLPFSKTKEVSVVVDDMDLLDFIHYIFSDMLGVNYLVDNQIERASEKVTLNLSRKITEYQLFMLTKDLLKQHGITVYAKENIFYLSKGAEVGDVAIGIGASHTDIPDTLGKVKQLIPIKYADAQNLARFMPEISGLKVIAVLKDNLLVATGTRELVQQAIDMIAILDRPAMRGRYIGIQRLNYWTPGEMAEKLGEILVQEGIPITSRPGHKGLYFNTLERWGSLIFFAAEKGWLDRVRYWIKLLDIPVEKDEKQYFIYFPENSKVGELGESLVKILGLEEPGFSIKTETEKVETNVRQKTAGAGRRQGGGATDKAVAKNLVAMSNNVRLAVDENRNALIFYTTPEKYHQLQSLLQRLDIVPVQVLLEASLAEVTLTGSLQYGLEWYLNNTDMSQNSVLSTLGGLGLGTGGLDYSLVTDSQKFKLLINAMAKEDLVEIIFSPRITIRDGKSASIVVGTEVPVITSEATTPDVQVGGTSGIIRSVQYRSTGVSLQVTPTVHARGIVTLEITQEVSEAQANTTSDISSPIILNRTITTEVVAADGQTVMLGGLIKKNNSRGNVKVPILGDLPFLGHLFKTNSKGSDRTELVIMITPHIVRDSQQMDELQSKILDSFEHLGRSDH